MSVPGQLQDRAGAERLLIHAPLPIERTLDEVVQIEWFVRHAEGPDALARSKLFGPQFQSFEHADRGADGRLGITPP